MQPEKLKQTNTPAANPVIANLAALKAKQKATWESGDFGQIAPSIEQVAEEFMERQGLRPGMRVLDVACGTGNLAVIAAKHGCNTSGVDIAANLLAQARARAAKAGLPIEYKEGDAEALPF
ncbi:MAG TPA: methyltransferase domain-containing protein, partial [Verrucomicrobiae bacterium]|nr:methyltransferase domain-containing protein [Verrucomicrobiae bacterium]